jgi:hypothetical protein
MDKPHSETNHSDENLIATLQDASCDLTWMSESDYPFESFCWEDSADLDDQKILQLTNQPEDATIEAVDLDCFFEVATQPQDWHGEEELAIVQKYQNLVATLKDHLIEPKVYRIGNVEVQIYVVGQTSAGNLAGVKTVSIET